MEEVAYGGRRPVGRAVCRMAAWLVAGFLVAPMFVTLPLSLTPTRYLSMPEDGVSLRHFRTVFTDPAWLSALGDSALVGLGASAMALVLGVAAAIGVWRLSSRLTALVGSLVLLPLLVPPVVSALALSRSWVALGLFDTVFGVMLAHTVMAVPFVFLTVSAALDGLDPRIEQAARSLGAGPRRAVVDTILPNIKPGLFTGAVFAFFISWDEIVVTLFVSSRSVFTLPRKIWSDIRDAIDPAVAAVSVVLIAITITFAVLHLVFDRRRGGTEGDTEGNS